VVESRVESEVALIVSEFEWDPRKRLGNLEKHGLDFADAPLIFARQPAILTARQVGSEDRHLAVGLLEGRHVAVIYIERDGAIRVISMRRARPDEQRAYETKDSPLHG